MTEMREDRHLPGEALQGYLDGSLEGGEAERVRAHASECARCRSELEAWQTLFHRLGELRDLSPSPGFSERVMSSLETDSRRAGVAFVRRAWSRLLRWARPRSARAVTADGHLAPERVQDFLDGSLPRRAASSVESHLDGCRLCRERVDGWRALFLGLEELPRHAPSDAFRERVMAHVRVRMAASVARPTLGERLAAWAELHPRTRRRLAAAAGAAVTPLVALVFLAYTVLSHPLVSVDSLIDFVTLKAGDTLAVIVGSPEGPLAGLHRLFDAASVSPALGAAVGLTFALLSALSLWVLYRNVVRSPGEGGGYAH